MSPDRIRLNRLFRLVDPNHTARVPDHADELARTGPEEHRAFWQRQADWIRAGKFPPHWLVRVVLENIHMPCDVCARPAIYRSGFKGFCSRHKAQARAAQVRSGLSFHEQRRAGLEDLAQDHARQKALNRARSADAIEREKARRRA